MNRLQDRVAIVTGAAGGIGKAIVQRLGSDGARVVLADIDESGANAVATELGFPDLWPIKLDITGAYPRMPALGPNCPAADIESMTYG